MKRTFAYAVVFAAITCLFAACAGNDNGNNDEMKSINVKKVSFEVAEPSPAQVAEMFDREGVGFNPIDVVNWEEFSYVPEVKFRIAHSDNEIYLQYVVKENGVRATFGYDGVPAQPYTDDCVEFFMIPSATDSIYYNLELNCIGHCTLGAGVDRKERTRFDSTYLAQVRRQSTLGSEPFGDREGETEWTLTIAIPKAIYSLSDVQPFSGRTVKANFYKCGDKTAVPHYLSWNPIPIEKPNFHRPDCFGNLVFE